MSLACFPPMPPPVDLPRQERARIGRPALAPGDDAAEYEALLAWAAASVVPADVQEWVWLRDVVDLIWDARRLRRARAGLLAVAHAPALSRLGLAEPGRGEQAGSDADAEPAADDPLLGLLELSPPTRTTDLVLEALARREPGRTAPKGFEAEAVDAEVFRFTHAWLEYADRALSLVEGRRDTLLRELERRRHGLASRFRPVVEAAERDLAPAISSPPCPSRGVA